MEEVLKLMLFSYQNHLHYSGFQNSYECNVTS
ncbi:hypothetical protein NC652_038727 [Populus alba x Populus x berolinensis]|uniref:Uncharacterized protein n=1 Tax=Populus alba x Populus x berolinensis TaxID=444605 RepID=A0AAD6LHM5_9ROSI|nr:hypothetical protein NC652_038727 [Populus alba x Populus x berolinensis]KAJ6960740.1 hypothetical protein NC653_038686 [Populus alba x Populus x berolinensis]